MKFEKLVEDAQMPTTATPGSAGYDLYSREDKVIPARGRAIISTGITAQFDKAFALKISSRSGLAFKYGLTSFHGTIDSDYYPGEIKVLMFNNSDKEFEIANGEKISQLLLIPISKAIPAQCVESERTGGFGSTGRK